jgi:uncharacterized protein
LSAYLDTSVMVPLFLNETHSFVAKAWIISSRQKLFYSHFAQGELNSAISRNVHMGVVDEGQAESIRSAAAEWLRMSLQCVEIDDEDIEMASKLVTKPLPKLLMPDAIHLVVCKRTNLALVTLDKDLLTIAAREGVVAISPA